MELILFVALIAAFVWIAGINSRLHLLEKKLLGENVAPQAPFQHANSIVPPAQPAAVIPKSVPKTNSTEDASGWFTKIGILAVIFGVGFFIKYAIDMGWISEWTRVIMGLASGILLCVLGNLWKKKYSQYASALTGGGIALLYFSLFAAYQFYHLVPQAAALVCMVIVSAVGVYLAYDRKSLSLAALSIFGAYLAPILLSSGQDSHTALFIYLGILTFFVLAINFSFYSTGLLLLAFFCGLLDYIAWAAAHLNSSNTWPAVFFGTFLFLSFIIGSAAAYYRHAKAKTLPATAEGSLALFSILLGIFYSSLISVLLYENHYDYLSLFALLGSVGAFIAYALVDRLEFKKLNYSLAFVGAKLLVLACLWQFSGSLSDFMLIALGFVMLVSGVFLKRAELRVWGLITLVACVFAVLVEPYDNKTYVFILNAKFGLALVNCVALWAAGWLYSFVESTDTEKQAKEIAHSIGSLLLWFAFSWEIAQYFRSSDSEDNRNLLLSLWWIVYGTALMVFGAIAKSGIYKKIAAAIFILAILKVFLYDVLALEMGYRVVSFIVLGVILLSVSYFYQKNKDKIVNFLEGGEGKIIS